VVLAPYALDLERVLNQKLVVMVSQISVEKLRNPLNPIRFSATRTHVSRTLDRWCNLWITLEAIFIPNLSTEPELVTH
jgi:hypothetical protein